MVRFLPAGDTALTIEFGEVAEFAMSAMVLALDRRLAGAGLAGVVETVPTLRSLTVHYLPSVTTAAELQAAIEPLREGLEAAAPVGRRWHLPVHYGDADGPDLEAVARHAGLAPEDCARLHASIAYRIYMIGFLPGHPYMGDLPPALRLPRRDTPRVAVPAGSVAIATTMTVIYPWESPGGWHIIGRTPAPLFDMRNAAPALLAPGDVISFEPIDSDALESLEERGRDGSWRPEPEMGSP